MLFVAEVSAVERLLTIPEVASRLKLSRTKTYELASRGTLRSIRIGASRRIPVEELDRFVDDLLAQAGRATRDRAVTPGPVSKSEGLTRSEPRSAG